VPAGEVLARQGIAVPGCDRYLALSPLKHDTDGFFAAVLQRAA
jgi:16S rRNA (cytosine967-C5)-methyltransferase